MCRLAFANESYIRSLKRKIEELEGKHNDGQTSSCISTYAADQIDGSASPSRISLYFQTPFAIIRSGTTQQRRIDSALPTSDGSRITRAKSYDWIEIEDNQEELPRIRGYFGDSSTHALIDKATTAILGFEMMNTNTGTSAFDSALLDDLFWEDEYTQRQKRRFLLSDQSNCALPSKRLGDHLVECYFTYIHPVYPFLHEPSFRSEYENTWKPDVELSFLWSTQLQMVFALGTNFASYDEIGEPTREGLSDKFYRIAKGLIADNLLEIGSLRMVQNLLLMSVHLHNTGRDNVCWNFTGLAIRVAQGIALHLEPTTEPDNFIESEVERRAWWGCYIMDTYDLM